MEADTLGDVKRPVMRYHGGKWLLAKWIIGYFPKHRCYVEPFGGAASVLMQKERSYAEVYNDLHGEIVNVFRVLRDSGDRLREAIRLTPFSRDEFVTSYIPSSDPIEQARRTIARTFMGFGSNAHNKKTGFRSNSNRSGTTPAHDWMNYADALPWMVDRLRGVVIENRHAFDVMNTHDSEQTLHYVDPPYVAGTRDKGGDYAFEMNDAEHRDLGAVLSKLKGAVIVSGYRSDLYDEIYAGWDRFERSSYADGARPRIEVIWTKNIRKDAFLF